MYVIGLEAQLKEGKSESSSRRFFKKVNIGFKLKIQVNK